MQYVILGFCYLVNLQNYDKSVLLWHDGIWSVDWCEILFECFQWDRIVKYLCLLLFVVWILLQNDSTSLHIHLHHSILSLHRSNLFPPSIVWVYRIQFGLSLNLSLSFDSDFILQIQTLHHLNRTFSKFWVYIA